MTMQSDLLPPVTLSEAKNYLSDQKMYDILLQAGWPKHLLEKAYEIAFLESSHAADVTRDYTGDASYGVFQIRPDIHTINFIEILGDDWADPNSENYILDPVNNAKVALHIYEDEVTADGKDKWFNWTSHVRTENLEGRGTHLKEWYLDPTKNTSGGNTSAKTYQNTLINLNSTQEGMEGVRPRWKRLMESQHDLSEKTAEKFEGLSAFSYDPNAGYAFDKGSSYNARRKQVTDDYLNDHVKTEVEQEDIFGPAFEPNFISKNKKGGARGAAENMVQ